MWWWAQNYMLATLKQCQSKKICVVWVGRAVDGSKVDLQPGCRCPCPRVKPKANLVMRHYGFRVTTQSTLCRYLCTSMQSKFKSFTSRTKWFTFDIFCFLTKPSVFLIFLNLTTHHDHFTTKLWPFIIDFCFGIVLVLPPRDALLGRQVHFMFFCKTVLLQPSFLCSPLHCMLCRSSISFSALLSNTWAPTLPPWNSSVGMCCLWHLTRSQDHMFDRWVCDTSTSTLIYSVVKLWTKKKGWG